MALDTLSALSVPLQLALVVSDQPALEAQLRRAGIAAEVISEPGHGGMNSALVRGALELRARGSSQSWHLCGDLPALEAGVCRDESSLPPDSHRRSFIADASGVGTTILVAHDVELLPHFGAGRLPLTTPLAQ